MWKLEFLLAAFFCSVILGETSVSDDNTCEKKEVSLINLEIAETFIIKARDIFPNCTDVVTNTTECGAKEKASAYLDMALKLISEAKVKFPICIKPDTKEPVTKEPDTKEPVTKEPEIKEPVTEEPEIEKAKSRDCSDVLQNGDRVSGVYTIWPNNSQFPNKSLKVFCDMDTDGGGWTVVQRRGDFTPQEDFYRDWNDYKVGFGNLSRDFWLGNDNLFVLSNQGKYKIQFDLESLEGEKVYALYKTFRVENEEDKYKLHIGDYSGSAGDAMAYHNGMFFSTKDHQNDMAENSCAIFTKGGWWFKSCNHSHPNGVYKPGGTESTSMRWWQWKKDAGLAAIKIKIKTI